MTIISPQLGISPLATTGGETYDRELLKQFVKLGLDVRILLPKNASFPKELQKKIDRTLLSHFIPPYTFNFFSLPWILKKVRPCLCKVGPSCSRIVRIHSPEYLFPTAFLIKKFRSDIPIIAHYHLDQTGKLWTKTNNVLLNMVDAVIADSEFLKRQLIERVGVNEKKIHVIHCGVDVEGIRPSSKEKGKRKKIEGIKTILFLGRFIERKRPNFAIDVFAHLHQKHPHTRLVMVGEGTMEDSLKAQSTRLKISDAVEFPGPLFGEEKLKQYHNADLFLFPSEKEGFVLVVLEAMAAGLPLLVPNSLGFPEAVQNRVNGFLASENPLDWVEKAEKILYNESINCVMRSNSRKIAVKKFSWERCARRNIDIYEHLVKTSV